MNIVLSAAPAKSGPLDFPSEKSFLLFFARDKTHVSKIVKLFSNSLFLRRHKPKMIFGQTTPWTTIESVNFKDFV